MKFENISASYDVGIAREFGIPSAVLLNKLLYLSKNTNREDGFCWRTADELEQELGISRKQQELAIKKLEDAGIIETKNTYIIGTQIKCKHFKIIDLYEKAKSDLYEREKSEIDETYKSVNNNKTIIKDNNNIYIKHGTYKRVKLTEKEYTRLIDEFGKDFIDKQIELLDEYIQSNNNKNKYTDFNLVLRKSIRNNWFKNNNKKEGIIPEWFNKEIEKEKLTEEQERMLRYVNGED